MNGEAYARYKKADKRLNQTYLAILNQYRHDTLFIRNLKKSQRIWLQLRDADLQMKYPPYESGYYGTMHPMCEADELTVLTEARTRRLRVWLTGIPEGDGCIGSVKFAPDPKRR